MGACRAKLRQARRGAVGDRLREGDCCQQWGARINDLILWCRCGGRRARLSSPGDRRLSHGLCLGSLTGSSHQLPSAVGFVFARSGMQRHIPVMVHYIWGWGGAGGVCSGRMGWQSSHKVSRHPWVRNSAVDGGTLASCCVWSLVSGLGPWCQADQVGTHSLGWGRLLPQTLRKGTGYPSWNSAHRLAEHWLALAPFRGRLGIAVESLQCLGYGSVSHLPPRNARPEPSGTAKNELPIRSKCYLCVSNLGYRWEMMSRFDF